MIAQTPTKLSIKDQNFISLNVTEAAYNANTSKFLGSKNITLTPYRITEGHYIEYGFLKGVGNITNNQTFIDTFYPNKTTVGRGNGTFETIDGQKITWISSDIGRITDNQMVFYGTMLFNTTHSKSLSILNNTIGLFRSTAGLNEPEYIWLLKK